MNGDYAETIVMRIVERKIIEALSVMIGHLALIPGPGQSVAAAVENATQALRKRWGL